MSIEAKERNTEVKHIVLENAILQEEVNVVKFELQFCNPVAEVLYPTDVKLIRLGSFAHKDLVGGLNRKLIHKQLIFVG